MLKIADDSLVAKVISKGQSKTAVRNFSNVVHVGIMFDNVHIMEPQGSGIDANNLLVGNKTFQYHVFRSTAPQLAAGAGECAKLLFDIHKTHSTMKYNLPGAAMAEFRKPLALQSPKTMDDLLTAVLSKQNNSFFCSQFVVYVYQYASYQLNEHAPPIFQVNAGIVVPARLAHMLFHMPQFSNIGFLPSR